MDHSFHEKQAESMADGMLLTDSDEERTFRYEESLPSLPIPPLQHTLDRYLDSVKPFLSEDEFRQTEFLVQQFASGVGQDLNLRLHEKAKYLKNWMEKWWEEIGYLQWRPPVSLINMAGPGPYSQDVWPVQTGTQTERAALLMYYTIYFWRHLRKERVRAQKDRSGNYLSMNQFQRLFSTCKIPGVFQDQLLYYFKTEREGDSPTHVVLMCRGRIFAIDCFHEDGLQLTAPEFQYLLDNIRQRCDSALPGPGLGNLTADYRTKWAQTRSRLISLHPKNYKNLEIIQKAILVIALDDDSPSDENDLVSKGLCGNAGNKWMDKSLNFVVFQNGLVASSCDHSPFDAMVLVVCTYYVHLKLKECNGKWQGTMSRRPCPLPAELEFELNDQLRAQIEESRKVHQAQADSIQASTYYFNSYGKDYLKKVRFHPDTYVQLAMQYAYYRKYGKPAPTYETATTRQFYHARTETMRPCTSEALAWCKAMMERNMSINQRYQMFSQAAARHNFLMQEASSMKGCDRHLFGLAMVAREDGLPIPTIFQDPAFFKSGGGGNFVLSTSCIGYTSVFGGVAPMCKNGYGIFYKIDPDRVVFFLTSWTADEETDTFEFARMLQLCLDEMKLLIDQGQSSAKL